MHWFRGISVPKMIKSIPIKSFFFFLFNFFFPKLDETKTNVDNSQIKTTKTKITSTSPIVINKTSTPSITTPPSIPTRTPSPSSTVQPIQKIDLLVQNQADKTSLLCQMNIFQFNSIQSDPKNLLVFFYFFILNSNFFF